MRNTQVKVKFEMLISQKDFSEMLNSMSNKKPCVNLDFLAKRKAIVLNWFQKKEPIYGLGYQPVSFIQEDGECELQILPPDKK